MPSFLVNLGAGCQSGRDEIQSVGPDGVDALVLDVAAVLVRQFLSGSEFGVLEGAECCGDLIFIRLF